VLHGADCSAITYLCSPRLSEGCTSCVSSISIRPSDVTPFIGPGAMRVGGYAAVS
jgi:hypothetical protein